MFDLRQSQNDLLYRTGGSNLYYQCVSEMNCHCCILAELLLSLLICCCIFPYSSVRLMMRIDVAILPLRLMMRSQVAKSRGTSFHFYHPECRIFTSIKICKVNTLRIISPQTNIYISMTVFQKINLMPLF